MPLKVFNFLRLNPMSPIAIAKAAAGVIVGMIVYEKFVRGKI